MENDKIYTIKELTELWKWFIEGYHREPESAEEFSKWCTAIYYEKEQAWHKEQEQLKAQKHG
jgi:hypothetical protein